MARKLLFLRHGDIGEQYRDRYVGSTDVSMSPRGHRQVSALQQLLRKSEPCPCVSSPMKRCRETAAVITEAQGLKFTVDPDLREIDFGLWEGMTFGEIQEAFPGEMDRWAEFKADFTIPGGEKIADFRARIIGAAHRLETHPADTLVVCTHGGVIRFLICHFLGLRARQYILFKVKHASVTTIELFDGAGVLSGLNECGPVD